MNNTKIKGKLRIIASTTITTDPKKKKKAISLFRFYCMQNLSPKLVNKKYLLSRFSFNKLAHSGKLPGIVKKGW